MDSAKELYPKLAQAFTHLGEPFPVLLPEQYARIMQRIEQLWDTPEALPYLNDTILEDRDGRQGFSFDVLKEMAQIRQVYDFIFPTLNQNLFDPFSDPRAVAPPKKTTTVKRRALSHINLDLLNKLQAGQPIQPRESSNTEDEQDALIHLDWPEIHSRAAFIHAAEQLHRHAKIYAQQGLLIGEILQHYGLLNEETLRIVAKMQKRPEHKDQSFGEILIEIGVITPEDLTRALCIQTGVMMVDVLSLNIPVEVLKLLPSNYAREKLAVPIGAHQDVLYVATPNPFAFSDQAFFTTLTKKKIQLAFAPAHEIINGFNMAGFHKNIRGSREEFHNLANKARDQAPAKPSAEEINFTVDVSENDSTIINLVNKMFLNAIEEEASDIHIELFAEAEETHIRFRRDGHLEHFSDFPRAYHDAVVSRIKIMSELDISERRRPQDGKLTFTLPNGKHVDLRVATIPTMRNTEFVTIRILAAGEPLPLSQLGIAERDLAAFRDIFLHPYGLILVCGPTGSGKTTTLHSVLKELNTDERKIWTAEDPVEIVQEHLCQVQVNSKAGTTFASILRAFLRADPDIIMIGEMRDRETAKIALEASMTGHLVLSTLHTNSASETVARLLDLDIDPYNLSDALLAILAQRLARKLCAHCASRHEASPHELEELANEYHQAGCGRLPSMSEREALIQHWRNLHGDKGKIYLLHARGCTQCNHGYKGRIGLYELLQGTPQMRSLIRHHAAAGEYQTCGIKDGMRTLKQDGIEKVLLGITDMAQVHAACV